MNERQNKRINDFEKKYIERIKRRLNQKLEESGMTKAKLYEETGRMGFSFSDKALYNAFNYSETSLNSMVIAAVCRILHISVSWLFAEDETEEEEVSFSQHCGKEKMDKNLYSVLTDEHYMHTYHCYIYKPMYKRLYRSCELVMEKVSEDKANAFLKICDEVVRFGEKKPHVNNFTGVPVLCKSDNLVYIVFTSSLGYIQILCFQYKPYKTAEMYFRTGFLIMVNPSNAMPQMQKVVLSSRKLEVEELPYIEGLLKVSGDNIMLTQESMAELFEENSDNPLMQRFEKEFMPLFKLLEHTCYVVNEKEIMSYSASRMSERERLKAIMLLKGKSQLPREINIKDHEELPRLIRDGIL